MKRPKIAKTVEITEELYNIAFPPTEEITEALAIELVGMGWEPEQIHDAQAAKLVYNRQRNSFMTHWSML